MTITVTDRRPADPVVLSTCARVDAALAAATREVLMASTVRDPSPDPLRRLEHAGGPPRGVRHRVLLDDRVRELPTLALRLGNLKRPGTEIRTLPGLPADLVVVDRAAALLPVDGGAGRPAELAMFRLPSVVATAVALFERLWPAAVPVAAWRTDLDRRERELLALLSAGCTDESAAARLGISVRTVRRTMAAVMDRLGARSRFEAGLKAADQGLLAPLRPPS